MERNRGDIFHPLGTFHGLQVTDVVTIHPLDPVNVTFAGVLEIFGGGSFASEKKNSPQGRCFQNFLLLLFKPFIAFQHKTSFIRDIWSRAPLSLCFWLPLPRHPNPRTSAERTNCLLLHRSGKRCLNIWRCAPPNSSPPHLFSSHIPSKLVHILFFLSAWRLENSLNGPTPLILPPKPNSGAHPPSCLSTNFSFSHNVLRVK